MKSQRWLCTKGLNKNNNIYMPNMVFEKYTHLTYDISENCYIKETIQKILDIVISIEGEYKVIYGNSMKTISQKKDVLNKNKIHCNILVNDNVIGREIKYNKKQDIKYLGEDIDKLVKKSLFILEILNNLKRIKSVLLYYLRETWLSDISYLNKYLVVSQKILKDNRYYQIYDFSVNTLAIKEKNSYRKSPYFPNKKTSKLFEYYSVLLVINILLNDNFRWESGWLANNTNPELFSGEIPNDAPMIFKNNDDDLEVKITYEK